MDAIYTTTAAAEYLGLSTARVRALCAAGRLGRKVGLRAYLMTADELRRFKKILRKPGRPTKKQLAKRVAATKK